MRTLVIALLVFGCNAVPAEPTPGSGSASPVERVAAAPKDAGVDAKVKPDAAVIDDGHDSTSTWSVNFSPKGGCQSQVVKLILSAKVSVRVAAYSFTAQPVVDALIAQQVAGRDVKVLLDRINAPGGGAGSAGGEAAPGSKGAALKAGKVAVWIDAKHSIMHDKFVVVDGKITETGSYNYTGQAETSNAENCFIYHNTAAAEAFTENWNLHQSHSSPL
jgi:phosphatidylserine/phosphatidylglycerophosphate/cardiolipin synthase-like enzyme